MPDDHQQIRDLITRWANAVHDGDLDTVLADHAEDIVMFDVPPPEDGVRGLGAYRNTWPPFFEWQRSGGSFEIVTSTSPSVRTWRTHERSCGAARRRHSSRSPESACV